MSTPSNFPGFAFSASRMVRLWRSEIDRRLAKYGLTESRWLTLFHLKKLGGEATQTELAEAVGVKGPTMVKTIDWLEAEQFIERCNLAADRRTKTIRFKPKGSNKFDEIQAIVTDLRQELMNGLDAGEVKACFKVFHAISQKLSTLHNPDLTE